MRVQALDVRHASAEHDVLRHFPGFLASLGVGRRQAGAITGRFVELLGAPGDLLLDGLDSLIAENGLREPWGQALATARAELLSRWIAPQLVGSCVLDLLCGDGAVGMRLEADAGVAVRLVEREHQRGVVERPWAARIEDFEPFARCAQPAVCDTAVLVAVLHHEEDPSAALALAARSAARRVVIVENCLEPDYGCDYHLVVDRLFNASLFHTGLPCPGQHRTAAEWVAMGCAFGHAHVVDRRTDVPGIPLAHTLNVLDLEAGR
jgi:hypothetical protein